METKAGKIYSIMPRIMEEMGAIPKSHKNPQQGYKFRGYEDVYAKAQQVCPRHGVTPAPHEITLLDCTRFEYKKRDGNVGTGWHILISQVTRFWADDASYMDITTLGEGIDYSDKAGGKCMSTAHKYAFFEPFCIPTQEMPNVEDESPEIPAGPTPIAGPIGVAMDVGLLQGKIAQADDKRSLITLLPELQKVPEGSVREALRESYSKKMKELS